MSLMEFGFTKAKIDKVSPQPNKRKISSSKESKKSPLKTICPIADSKESSSKKSSSFASNKDSKTPESPTKTNSKKTLDSQSEKALSTKSSPKDKKSPSKLSRLSNILNNSHSNKSERSPTSKEKSKPGSKMKSPDKSSPEKFQGFASSSNSGSPLKCSTPSSSKSPGGPRLSDSLLTPKESPNQSKSSSPNLTDVVLPAQRVKLIMKSCPDVDIVPQEALFLISKATESFIHLLVNESLEEMPDSTLDYECVSKIVHSRKLLDFLKETIPRKITWAEAQKLIAARKKDSIEDYL